ASSASRDSHSFPTRRSSDLVYVAKSVPMSLRRDKLSFGHHMLVAAMEPDDQHAWLDYAERMQLSVSELRKAINGEPAKKPPTVIDRKSTRLNSSHVKISYAV